jgi:hypothetical protein
MKVIFFRVHTRAGLGTRVEELNCKVYLRIFVWLRIGVRRIRELHTQLYKYFRGSGGRQFKLPCPDVKLQLVWPEKGGLRMRCAGPEPLDCASTLLNYYDRIFYNCSLAPRRRSQARARQRRDNTNGMFFIMKKHLLVFAPGHTSC